MCPLQLPHTSKGQGFPLHLSKTQEPSKVCLVIPGEEGSRDPQAGKMELEDTTQRRRRRMSGSSVKLHAGLLGGLPMTGIRKRPPYLSHKILRITAGHGIYARE